MGHFRLPLAFVLVNGLLLAPGWTIVGELRPPWLTGEAALLVPLLFFLPRTRWSRRLAFGLAVLLTLSAGLLAADAAARLSLSRPLNLYLDWHLLGPVWKLLAGSMGPLQAAAVFLGLGASASLVAWGLGHLLSALPSPSLTRSGRLVGAGCTAALVIGTTALPIGWWGEQSEEVAELPDALGWPTARFSVEQARGVGRLLAERDAFAVVIARSPSTYREVSGLLERLRGRTVVLAFLESYGISALDDSAYASVILSRLGDLERRMAASGLHIATGSLVAPTQGGQSWFSHGTLLSGLWLDNQLKYDLLLTSDRETLIDDFRRAGYETVALMPAITLAWPEGRWFGYDEIYAHRDIDYAGPALNWVTMPDQFTWSFLERTVRVRAEGRPLFAEVGLISSHAPWTPILPVLEDWDAIGDGSVFAQFENAGERPEELWRNIDQIREHFALALDYALHATTAYAERYVDGRTLLIVLGDHQPAPLITGEGASRAVPIHVISGDSTLVSPFLEWGFTHGAIPASGEGALRMDAFRDWFVRAFSRPATHGNVGPSPMARTP